MQIGTLNSTNPMQNLAENCKTVPTHKSLIVVAAHVPCG